MTCVFLIIVYIPHSSDKTWVCHQAWWLLLCVYIPHSSDKTMERLEELELEGLFTSHIVQTKPLTVGRRPLRKASFTSHIVQTKRKRTRILVQTLSSLHPTQFRQNVWNRTWTSSSQLRLHPTQFRQNSIGSLLSVGFLHVYIPHSSDKTRRHSPLNHPSARFTSHIVQTKPLPSIWQMDHAASLHPTQFRQNYDIARNHKRKEVVYIPHSSDKTKWLEYAEKNGGWFTSHIVQTKRVYLIQEERRWLCSLHPTQFRQNWATRTLTLLQLSVYIPHSSDKTLSNDVLEISCDGFTSHIVQTKHIRELSKSRLIEEFTSHIVQTKREMDNLMGCRKEGLHPTQFRQNGKESKSL